MGLKRGGRERERGVFTKVGVSQLRKARSLFKVVKPSRRRVVKLGRPRARKGSDGDVAYIIELDIMLVRMSKLRVQLISNSRG